MVEGRGGELVWKDEHPIDGNVTKESLPLIFIFTLHFTARLDHYFCDRRFILVFSIPVWSSS